MYNPHNQNVGITTTNVNIQNATFGNFKHETTVNGVSIFQLGEVGVNALRPSGYNKGSFDNENVQNIYKNGKLLSLYDVYNGATYTYTLKFDGDVYNGGWEWLEIIMQNFTSYNDSVLRLKRKDAKWHHVKKEFTWIVSRDDRRKGQLFGSPKLVIN